MVEFSSRFAANRVFIGLCLVAAFAFSGIGCTPPSSSRGTNPAAGSDGVDDTAARALLDLAVDYWGGTALLDSTASFEVRGAMALHEERSDQIGHIRNLTVVPSCLRRERVRLDGQHFLKVLDGDNAFMTVDDQVVDLPDVLRAEMREDFLHNRFVLFRLRKDATVRWAGEETIDGKQIGLIDVLLSGVETRLGIDRETGQLIALRYRALDDEGNPGQLRRVYSDFQEIDGRHIATQVAATFDGEPYFSGGFESVQFSFGKHTLADCNQRPDPGSREEDAGSPKETETAYGGQ